MEHFDLRQDLYGLHPMDREYLAALELSFRSASGVIDSPVLAEFVAWRAERDPRDDPFAVLDNAFCYHWLAFSWPFNCLMESDDFQNLPPLCV